MKKTDKRYAGKEAKYKDLKEKDIPLGECLKDTVARVMPFWTE
jgi:2,3-bisphosphoglycerate-dependent phosphoglycerate mutase